MSPKRIVEWLFIVATAVLLVVIKIIHIGVTHYNIFLLVLLGWVLGLVVVFRALAGPPEA